MLSIRQSNNKGLGLFAINDIAKGTKLYEPMHLVIPSSCLDEIKRKNKKKSFKRMLELGWGLPNGDIVLPLSIDMFVNHSEKPNSHNHGVALRNITKNEEIFEDYRMFDATPWYKELEKKYDVWTPNN